MRAIAVALLISVSAISAEAQTKKVSLVVGFSAGGTSSTAARVFAEALEKTSDLQVMVENRSGAGGLIAATHVKQQKGTGTLLFMSATSSLRVPPEFGLVPVCLIATYPYVAAVRMQAPDNLMAYMKAADSDSTLENVATAGAGSIPHLIGERMFANFGVRMTHIPYSGSAQAIQDVYGGHVSMAIVPLPDFVPFKESLRVIARSGEGIETGGWVGIFAPPGVDAGELGRLARLFRPAVEVAREKLAVFGFEPNWQPGPILHMLHEGDNEQLMPIAKQLGVNP
jgi:tripartite-type tricarboxylate transporter receptor subunit TctC